MLGGALCLSAMFAVADSPRLTGLARKQGLDAAWLWFPDTATSVVLQRGEAQGGYKLLEVDHAHGSVRLETLAGLVVIRFGATVETGARTVAPAAAADASVTRRASQNAARAMGLTTDDVPETYGPPPTIDQIAARARRRLHPTPAP